MCKTSPARSVAGPENGMCSDRLEDREDVEKRVARQIEPDQGMS